MSRQSEAKKAFGWRKEHPCCGNCKNFSSEIQEVKTRYSSYFKERMFRCIPGKFKTGKSSYCLKHKWKKESPGGDARGHLKKLPT